MAAATTTVTRWISFARHPMEARKWSRGRRRWTPGGSLARIATVSRGLGPSILRLGHQSQPFVGPWSLCYHGARELLARHPAADHRALAHGRGDRSGLP